jgi:hypothetical protein
VLTIELTDALIPGAAFCGEPGIHNLDPWL